MPTPSEKLAASLEVLRELQTTGRRVFRSADFSRLHRERLIGNGFLQPVMKGWLISSRPDASAGDTTPWHSSFWEFCARYASHRFGDQWHLSPELSLLLHAEATALPRQVVIHAPEGTNNSTELLFGTSIYDLMVDTMPARADMVTRDGLRLFTPVAALVRVPDAFFLRHPVEAQAILAMVADVSDLLAPLLEGGRSAVAGRLAGALRRLRRTDAADEIVQTMKAAGYDVRESDPFAAEQPMAEPRWKAPPMARRLEGLWAMTRDHVFGLFPAPPQKTRRKEDYLRDVDGIYQSDAYHSLSIEGYSVTLALIERVKTGSWDPEHESADRRERDGLAARGYWQSFQLVKNSVKIVLEGENSGIVARKDHRAWYRELFQPFVAAGIIAPSALAGYRNDSVYLKGSRHVPPRAEAVRDAMPAYFDLLEAEPEPAVRAVLGHWLFGYIHPYPDGNGRIARFLMNTMLASAGYAWTVIRVEDRDEYLAALESASVDSDIRPFARFLGERVRRSLDRVET